MNKKISIVLLTVILVISGMWIWTFASPKKSIILGGSTSVNPFMQKITKEYLHIHKNDFVYNSTGSQAGVRGVEKNMYAAGFISKDLSEETLSGDNYKWFDFDLIESNYKHSNELEVIAEEFDKIFKQIADNKDVKEHESYLALEFASDAIAIVFNSPDWFGQEVYIDEDNLLSLNGLMNFTFSGSEKDKNLKIIYESSMTWTQLATNLVNDSNLETSVKTDFNKIISSNSSSQNIVKYTREDGSGTRSAFSDITGIKNMPSAQVANSNGSMLSKVKASPSIGYVSYSIFPSIEVGGSVRVAGIDGKKLGNPFDNGDYETFRDQSWSLENNQWQKQDIKNEDLIKDGYGFQRPFVAIFKSVSIYYSQLQDLFKYMLVDAKDIFEEEGLIQTFKFIWI